MVVGSLKSEVLSLKSEVLNHGFIRAIHRVSMFFIGGSGINTKSNCTDRVTLHLRLRAYDLQLMAYGLGLAAGLSTS